MVREVRVIKKSISLKLRKMFEIPGRQAHSFIIDSGKDNETTAIDADRLLFRSQGGKAASSNIDAIGSVFNPSMDKGPVSRLCKDVGKTEASPILKEARQPSGM